MYEAVTEDKVKAYERVREFKSLQDARPWVNMYVANANKHKVAFTEQNGKYVLWAK